MSLQDTKIAPSSGEVVASKRVGVYKPSMAIALFVCWILPVVLIAVASRFAVNDGPAVKPQKSRPVSLNLEELRKKNSKSSAAKASSRIQATPDSTPASLADKPTSYKEVRMVFSRQAFCFSRKVAEFLFCSIFLDC